MPISSASLRYGRRVAGLAGPRTVSLAADFDGPYYCERDVAIERPARPVVIERERIIERR